MLALVSCLQCVSLSSPLCLSLPHPLYVSLMSLSPVISPICHVYSPCVSLLCVPLCVSVLMCMCPSPVYVSSPCSASCLPCLSCVSMYVSSARHVSLPLCLSCQAPSLRLVSLVTLLCIYVVCCYSFIVRSSVMFMPCFQGFVLSGIYVISPGFRVQGFLCLLSSFLILGFFF